MVAQVEGPAPILNPGDVVRIQRLPASLGYSVGSIDGLAGPRTTSALRTFQFENGLPASGTADAQTLTALSRLLVKFGQRGVTESYAKSYQDFLNTHVGGVSGTRLLAL